MKNITIDSGLKINSSFISELKEFYACTKGEHLKSPKLIKLNDDLAKQLNLNVAELSEDQLAHLLTGSLAAKDAQPIAQLYAGHQFGGFSPQLGDGRAILMAEVIDRNGNRKDIHLKGSGQTPYSRGGDGKAAIGPVLREYLLGEAMHRLNIPTTRALAVTLTGEKVWREQMLDGAVLARVASSHIRVGSFQYFAARTQQSKVKQLADYSINRHYPELKESKNPYLALFREVRNRQASLIAQWVLLGFVHGVMNTDNMTISGETIDYGPCAFIDDYNPDAVYSSIDRQGRYSLSNQPFIGQWNMARFAETLLPFFDDDQDTAIQIATQEVQDFAGIYQAYWLQGVTEKIGLSEVQEGDFELTTDLFEVLEGQSVDFTNFFRSLSQASLGQVEATEQLFDDSEQFHKWNQKWLVRLAKDSQTKQQRVQSMNLKNPIYIPRNHLVEEALSAADNNDYQVFEQLLSVLSKPFEERANLDRYSQAAAKDFGPYKTYCGT